MTPRTEREKRASKEGFYGGVAVVLQIRCPRARPPAQVPRSTRGAHHGRLNDLRAHLRHDVSTRTIRRDLDAIGEVFPLRTFRVNDGITPTRYRIEPSELTWLPERAA